MLVSVRGPRTYVGITTELERRLEQHNGERPGGARSTRSGRPWALGRIYGPFPDRATAQSAEYTIKRLRGPRRLQHKLS